MDDMIGITTPSGKTWEYFNVCGIYFPVEARQFTDPESVIPKLPTMEARCDDVLVCGCLRSGTNWLWEIVNMLVKGKAEYEKGRKIPTVIEHAKQEHLKEMTSPRVLSTHMKYQYIPKDFIKKKCKIVYIQRNPKDVAVSFYKYRNSEFESMNISWEDYLYMFLNSKEDMYDFWWGTTKNWDQVIHSTHNHSIYLVYYEALKQNPLEELAKLAQFLCVKDDPEFIKDVAEKISFSNMKYAKLSYLSEGVGENKDLVKGFGDSVDKRSQYYRKGMVGDWKNQFTVAQNEHFDKMMSEKLKTLKMKIIYS